MMRKKRKNKLLLVPALMIMLTFSSKAQFLQKVSLKGYSSFEYEYLISDEGDSDPNGSFDADLFDIVLNVNATPRLRLAADVTWEHGVASEDDRGNVALEYAFPEYTVKNWLKFRAGKMFVPFGIYNEIHTAKPAFLAVKEPLSTNKPNKFGADERFYPRWATGLAVLGSFSLNNVGFEYIVQVSNGEQENTNPFEEDDNEEKAVAARLIANPSPNLKIGVSSYSDRLTELDTIGDDTGNRTKLSSFSVHGEYTIGNFGTELEYVSGVIDPTSDSKLKKNAFEAMVYYTFRDRYTPYIRYEFLDPNKDVDEDKAQTISFGINTRIDDGYFLKLQYNSVTSGNVNDRFGGVDFSEFQAAIVLGF